MATQPVSCGFCGNSNSEVLFSVRDWFFDKSEIFMLQKCGKCGLVFLNPRLKKTEDLSKYYRDELYSKDRTISYKVRQIEAIYDKGNICDVGCGRGFFLKEMQKKDWKTFGIEISPESCKYAEEILQLKVFNGEVKKANLPKNSFSYMTFWHSLEHLPNPFEVIEIAYKALKPEGKVIVAVPNIESFQARLFKEKWYHLDVPRHLFYFTPLTLENLLAKVGFRDIKIRHFIPFHNAAGWLWSLFRVFNLKFYFLGRNYKSKIVDPKYYLFNLMRFAFYLPCKIFSLVESIFKRGGTIQVTAMK